MANKTGWIAGIKHDAAVIFPLEGSPYVLVAMARGHPDEDQGEAMTADLSRMIWQGRQANRSRCRYGPCGGVLRSRSWIASSPTRTALRSGSVSLAFFARPEMVECDFQASRVESVLGSSMVGVAQLVRAPDCGSGGRRFNSGRPP